MGSHERSRLFRALTLAVALLAGVARAEETPAPSPDADAPKPPEAAEEAAKEAGKEEGGLGLGFLRNVIPIPEIILDPNEGNTYGLMAVWLITDEHDEIKYMVAPDVRYNDTKGVFPSFRLFGYPNPTQR